MNRHAGSLVRVLLVDDDADDAAITGRLLRHAGVATYGITWRDSVAAAVAVLAEDAFDVMLLDYELGDGTGLDVLREAAARGLEIPSILVTGKGGVELDFRAMDDGVVDFIEKDYLDGKGLDRSIRYAVGRARADRERRKAQEALLASQTRHYQAQKMEAIGQLAGGIAHDFNNQLTAIRCYCELVQRTISPGEQAFHDIGEVIAAVDRASALTRQLLAFSRRQVMQLRAIELDDAVRQMQGMLERLIGEDLELVVRVCGSPPPVRADLTQLEQVLLNLVVNARDAMPDGGVVLITAAQTVLDDEFVRVNPGSAPGAYVKLSVSDTGVGIPPEVQARVFEPFFTTKAQGKGTGLGLATVYGIVKQFEGYVTIDSAVGVGTAVNIYLPVSSGDATVEVASSLEEVCSSGGGERILVIEDSPHVRSVVQRSLESCGYRVAVAENAAAALAMLQQQPPVDLVLTDWIMPRMGGAALLKELQTRTDHPAVLVMTGYAHDSFRGGALGRDIPFIEKPFTASQIARRVREVLDTARCPR
jgi:signal transduction histidine kinase